MKYTEYPGEKTYVVFHTEGTGEQGGAPVVEKEKLESFDTREEAIAFGTGKYPRISGWEWDNFTININILTDKGKEEFVEFKSVCEKISLHMIEHPELYRIYELASGGTITLMHNPIFDGPLPE